MANKLWIGTDGNYGTSGNWSPSGVPTTGDNVRIPAGASSISSGLDQHTVAIGDFIVERGFSGTIASSSGYLRIDPDRFEFEGTGTSYIDVGSAAIALTVRDSVNAATGKRGLYLKGSAITTLNVQGGQVGLAVVHGETSSVSDARVTGNGSLWLGAGVTCTAFQQAGGDNELRCAAATVTVYDGKLRTTEIGAITTLNVEGGQVFPESTGAITTLNLNGGSVDFTTSLAARAVGTLNHNPGEGTSEIIYDPAIVTITTPSAPNGPCRQSRTVAA